MSDRGEERLSERPDFREFVGNFEGMVVWTGDESGFDYISSGYEDIWGRPVEEVRDDFSALFDGIHPDDVDRVRAVIEDEGLAGGDPETLEHRVVRPDGEIRWVEVRVVPVHDDDGDLTEVVGVTIDITDRKRTELDLQRQKERLEQFASVVSHDLRNPINVASGHVDLLREKYDDDSLAAVEDSLDRMERIIDDLLRLAREGRDVGSRSPVHLEDVARDAWRHVETGAATLAVDGTAEVTADADRLQELLENLFRNSVEHGSTSSRAEPGDSVEHGSTNSRPQADDTVDTPLAVRVGLLDDHRGFYVEDDGVGIPESERENVLEPGYSTAEDGTGFGLAIVRTIAEGHGWQVDVTESDDGGARFEFSEVELRR
ncbi:MAG: sensor histidine kinase [Haloplanus sp.]